MHEPAQPPDPSPLWGDVYPPPAHQCPPATPDGATQALELFGKYLANLEFWKHSPTGPEKVCIPDKQIFIGFPDYETNLKLPSAVMLGGKVNYNPNNLTPIIVEETRDKYCSGYVLHVHDEHEENFTLEVWAAKPQELSAYVRGIATAFQPSESITGIRFIMHTYYDVPVIFTLLSHQIVNDPDSALNRRRAAFEINMRFNVVSLEPYRPLDPYVIVNPG